MQTKLTTNNPYLPAEDTFFLEDYIKDEKGYAALDIGAGTGYLANTLSLSFQLVVGTDINYNALKQNYKNQNIICCDGADALSFQFDLIVCNMPYLATDEILDVATDGGKEGLEMPQRIIKSATRCLKTGGKFLFVTSSLSNYSKLIEITRAEGLDVKILSKRKLFFEELIIIEAKKPIA